MASMKRSLTPLQSLFNPAVSVLVRNDAHTIISTGRNEMMRVTKDGELCLRRRCQRNKTRQPMRTMRNVDHVLSQRLKMRISLSSEYDHRTTQSEDQA